MAENAVRVAGPEEVTRVLRTLSVGMQEDPVLAWLFPDDASRVSRIERLFGVAARLYPDAAEIYRNEDCTAGAFWISPGRFRVPIGRRLRMFPSVVRAVGGAAGLRMSNDLDKRHPKEPHHYYLLILAATQGNRGRGIGSALMQPVLERCDAEGVPAYLESANPQNQPFYRRYGFEIREEMRLPGGCPPIWGMWREPP